ncbi:hypothetical protein [Pseudoduganella namucuonensis]|uniref:IacB protein n=1 Tax=Pseudoduganella namucuonensis TaxID=1035707 RepID=A0A1I7LZD5_9BURK|nr:hypothetical protein [Pseudoduganella namucuonensis]SFV15071.1 hypothetical protein SAMN05216552_104444 [Pseudoduganella namucuonensis]
MSDPQKDPLRVLFCIGVTQNFFDLPESGIAAVWKGYGEMMSALAALPGVTVLGTMDDDRTMVGASASWPWTVYIMADVADLDTVVAGCNLFRTVKVGGDRLWKYGKIEARIGRALIIQGG